MAPKLTHVLSFTVGEKTEQEAVEAYCKTNGLDQKRFKNEEYGGIFIIISEIISPGDVV